MKNIYNAIITSKNQKLLAILLDPEKLTLDSLAPLVEKINASPATHILVGGSSFEGNHLDELIQTIKKNTDLTLLSGRNPDYLIEHQVNAVPFLKKTHLEVISTGYILIESGNETSVQKVSQTQPLKRDNAEYILQTAQAGELIGNKLIYLEAGSGAKWAVPNEIIELVAQNITIPILVGGGIRSKEAIENAYKAGATMVVIGTAFENDSNFFN